MMQFARKLPALLAVLLLSIPSAVGVQRALAPTRGELAAWLAAAGFEAVYLSVAVLSLSRELRGYAQRIALAAVSTAVVLNTIADYQARIEGGLSSWMTFKTSFDGLAFALSLIESVPLAGLAFAMAMLLHRLAEEDEPLNIASTPLDKPLTPLDKDLTPLNIDGLSELEEVKLPQPPLDKPFTSLSQEVVASGTSDHKPFTSPSQEVVASGTSTAQEVAIRLRKGMKQAAIARELGISPARVWQIKSKLEETTP